jgi:hypothetical protein
MAHWWHTAIRRRLELPVLHRYYDGLIRRVVVGYAWEQLVEDYTLCAVQSLYVAAAWCADERDHAVMRRVWLPQLKKALAAFTDRGCAELWG